MNIVTYASPVALQPPVYAIGLYKDTQSWSNWRANRCGLLQAGAVICSGIVTAALPFLRSVTVGLPHDVLHDSLRVPVSVWARWDRSRQCLWQ